MTKKMIVVAGAVATLLVAVAMYRHFFLLRPLLDQVRQQLNDPESAQFRNVRLFSDWTPGNSALCGEVNAKNKMGGYVGFQHFTSFGGGMGADIESADMTAIYDAAKLKRCAYAELTPWWGVPF